MCVSCGCGEPNERHGDERHITMDDLDQAAAAAETSRAQVIEHIAASRSDGSGQEGMQHE